MDLIKKVQKTITRYQLLRAGDHLIVAVSGGPDSVVLLDVLNSLRSQLGFKLFIAHFNHGLRKSAILDQRFVENLSRQLKLPFLTNKTKLLKNKKQGSIEELARTARLKFLFQCAKKCKTILIASGHTRDDLAETVLMRLLRGTGLGGLRSILPKRKINDFIILRPLIEVTRKEIMDYIQKNNLKFRIDPTNKDIKIFRNKIRHRLIPLLQKNYNTNICETLSHFAFSAAPDYDFLKKRGEEALKKIACAYKRNEKIGLKLKSIQQLHPAMQRLVIRLAIEKLKGNTRRLTFQHMQEIEELVHKRPFQAVVHLPNGMRATKAKNRLTLSVA